MRITVTPDAQRQYLALQSTLARVLTRDISAPAEPTATVGTSVALSSPAPLEPGLMRGAASRPQFAIQPDSAVQPSGAGIDAFDHVLDELESALAALDVMAPM